MAERADFSTETLRLQPRRCTGKNPVRVEIAGGFNHPAWFQTIKTGALSWFFFTLVAIIFSYGVFHFDWDTLIIDHPDKRPREP